MQRGYDAACMHGPRTARRGASCAAVLRHGRSGEFDGVRHFRRGRTGECGVSGRRGASAGGQNTCKTTLVRVYAKMAIGEGQEIRIDYDMGDVQRRSFYTYLTEVVGVPASSLGSG